MTEKLGFSVDGEFVCKLVRKMFWEENRPYAACEEILLCCLVNDTLSLVQRQRIVVLILEGRKKLVGINNCTLKNDGEQIRPLSLKFKEYERKQAIDNIRADMESRPLAYLDRFAAPFQIDELPEIKLHNSEKLDLYDPITEAVKLRLFLFSKIDYYGEAWPDNEFFDGDPPLDRGLYLLEMPELVYDLIGEPVNGLNEEKLFQKLLEYWEIELSHYTGDQALQIKSRNERYKASLRKTESTLGMGQHPIDEEDLLKRVSPDHFLSELGLIDLEGNWYSCTFAGHNTKAFYLIHSDPEKYCGHQEDLPNRYMALDTLYNMGWIVLRSPVFGIPYIDYKSDRRTTRAQVNTVFDYMIYFNRQNIDGLNNIMMKD